MSDHTIADDVIDLRYRIASLEADNATLVGLVETLKVYISEAQHALHDATESLRMARLTNLALREELQRYTRTTVEG